MKSKITKIQILKNGVVIMLAMMFLLTPIVYAATSLDDDSTPNYGNNTANDNNVVSNVANNNVENTNTGDDNTVVPGNSDSESGSSNGGLNWKEIFYGKVGAAADDIKKKISKDENGANKPGIIEIENEIQLRAIAELVNNGENNFKDITILLTKDIVINSDVEWTPIGIDNRGDANEEDYVDKTFRGNFIGCELDEQGKVKDTTVGKRISNLEYLKEGKTYKELTNIGLFGVIGEGSTVQNIIIDNFNINILYDNSDIVANSGSSEGYKNTYYYNAGNIAGINKGTIKNCFNLSNIKGGSCVGGLVGINYGTITSCTNAGVTIGYDFVGGITGINYGTIGYAKNIADVKGAEADVGGIAGAFRDGKEIILSHNIGNVEGRVHVGGIVGGAYSTAGSIKYCMNESKVSYDEDNTKVYGILGNMYDVKDFDVDSCVVIGAVETLTDANKAAYLRKLLDDDKYNKWGYIVENGIEYKYFDNGRWNNSIGQVQEIQEIKYNNVQVYILSGNRDTDTKGNVIYNPIVVGTGTNYNEFDSEGGFDIGSGLDVNIQNKEDDQPEEETKPVVPEEIPVQEGEVRQDITELFPIKDGVDGTAHNEASKTTVTYTVKKIEEEKETVITDKGYYRFIEEANEGKGAGEVITIVATFNKYLADEKGFEKAPTLEMVDKDGKLIAMEVKNISRTDLDFTTKVEYTYEVKEGDNFEVTTLKLSGCSGIKARGKSDIAIGENKEITTDLPVTIIADTIRPTLTSKVYVENNLETRRYKAGKVIIFEVTVSEVVNEIYTVKPLIQVNFSESGKGLYNYYKENGVERVGIAKFRSDLTPTEPNEDGTVTWVYSYQIQEGDEGELEPEYLEYQLMDLAGNKNSSKATIVEDVTGNNNWGEKNLNISIDKLYTAEGKEITEDTVLTDKDTLLIDVEFDKVLYAAVGEINKSNKLLKDTLLKYAPTLYLNASSILGQTSVKELKEVEIGDGKKSTIITYEYDLGKIIEENKLDKTIRIRKLALKNDANNSVIINEAVDGRLAYSEIEKSEYLQEEKDLYGIIEKDAIKEFKLEYRVNVNPNENAFDIVYDYIYADTTLPTVEITTNTTDPTNAKEIIYTFKFSEYVKGFTQEDITVNGGYKATRINDKGNEEVVFDTVKEGYEYTLKVIPTTPIEKEGTLQVIVEKGACLDLVAKELVRQEKNITIDKVKPTFIDYSVETKENKETGRIESITVTTVFSEELSDASSATLIPTLTVDGKAYKGTLATNVEGNKIKFVYNPNAAEGGKLELSLSGTVNDKAGNSSDVVSIKVENDITLEQVRIKDANNANVYYTFKDKNGLEISDYTIPTYFKAGEKITVTKYEDVDINGEKDQKTTVYEYDVTEEIAEFLQKFNGGKPVKMPFMLLIDSEIKDAPGKIEFALEGSNYINISEANIYFDVVAPTVTLSVEVAESNGDNIYKEGKELIITATTSEAIISADSVPVIKVGFTNSGSGKYNRGIAKYEGTITNADGSTTWKYKYVAQDGDDGKVVVEYAQNEIVTDLAGNNTTLKTLPDTNSETPNITDNEISEKEGGATKVSYEFYKKAEKESEYKEIEGFAQNTYFAAGDTIKVVAKFDKLLYSEYDDRNRVPLSADNLSKNVIDGLKDDAAVPVVEHDYEKETTTITYIYTVKDADKEEVLNTITLETKENRDMYSIYTKEAEVTDEEGNTKVEKETVKGTISSTITKDIEACNLWIYNSTTIVSSGDFNVDTVRPRVTIKSDVGNVTNSNKIVYTFEFSEKVVDFTEDDITVNGGAKGTLISKDNNVYELEVIPDVAEGDKGTVKVVIQENACKDKAGLENVRAESEVKVDRELPDFIKFVAYAPTDSRINLSEEVNAIKQYYTTGDTLKIVASFSESITTEAKPVILFGGKNAKGTLTQEKTTGNNITYTYTIVDGDEGVLTIGAFTGKAEDAAKNEITLSNRPLVGDTIIADTTAPTLNEIKVTSPESGIYKAGNTITIEAIYDEEVYVLEDDEVKLIKANIEVEEEDGSITSTTNAPVLKLKFGNGDAVDAVISGYGTKEDGSEDRSKLIYTYTIREKSEEEGNEYPGDNGDLVVYGYGNRLESEVCDIAGNKSVDVNAKDKQSGNEITADTTRPEVTNIIATVNDDDRIIKNTGIYHKAGNKVKITVEFNEEVSSAVIMPEILVGFSEAEGVEPTSYNTYSYESDWNVNSTTVEYTYTINDGDNGYLFVKVPEAQFKDKAGNTNIAEDATKCEDVFADTTAPSLNLYTDVTVTQNEQTLTIAAAFAEDLYWVSGNKRENIKLEDVPTMMYGFEGATENLEASATSISGNVVTYVITKEDTISGKFYHMYFKGNIYDRAGNPADENKVDSIAPKLESVVISSNAGEYSPYCKEGKEIYVVATFNEPIKTQNMKLKAKIGDTELDDISGVIIEEKPQQIKYTYTVKAGDMGEFKIVDICGETNSTITEENADKTYGWVTDDYGNKKLIYSLEKEGITPSGEAIADTKDPYISKVEAVIDGKVVATYTKEDGKDAVIKETRTTKTDVEYVITYSEPVRIVDESQIRENLHGEMKITTADGVEYYNKILVTVSNIDKVDNASHLITILGGAIEDRAGNINSKEEFKLVTIDAVKPEVIFTNNDDIKVFVIPTAGTLTIVQGVEFSEDISKLEYKWDNGEYVDITESYLNTQTNRVVIPEKEFISTGKHKLYVKATDIAGNVKEVWKEYSIKETEIDVTLSTYELTNKDIKVTVDFGNADEGLTEQRIVKFRKAGSDIEVEVKPNADGTYTITENGIVRASASDKAGHVVFEEEEITNIDKVAPVIDIALDRADLVIGTAKDKATIKVDVDATDDRLLEYAKYVFLQEDINVYEMNELEKAKIANNLNGVAKKDDAESTKGETPYYLYVIAKDKAGTEVIEKAGPFTVLDTNARTIKETIIPDILDDLLNPGDENKEPEIIEKEVPAEIEISKLIAFNQEGKHISITYNNFGEGEEYLDIIKEKDITLTEARDGYIDYEYYSYVDVNKATIITVTGKDACGNTVIATYEVTRESIEGPEFEVYGNSEEWTNQDIKLEVVSSEELSALTVNGQNILSADNKYTGSIVITENGEYKFVATDMYGLTSEKVIKVTKIDKVKPVISKVETSGKVITITATDVVNEIEGSGIAEYAITDTTELPVEWSESNVIKVTHDGAFFVWVKDIAGNITRTEETTIVDTTAPTIRFEYTLLTVVAGMPIEANIVTDEEAIISYSWDEETWVDSEEFGSNVRVAKKYDITGKYTLSAKATDKAGNESKSEIEFTVTKPETVLDPQVVFEGLYTTQIDGVHYVKVAANMTAEDVTSKMKKDALCGVTPEYIKLAEGDKLKTGSEIALNGDTKYIVVVNGDVNCDGKIDFLGDIISANNYRIGVGTLSTLQKLAADIDNDGKVEFISDILAMNNYRIGITSSL